MKTKWDIIIVGGGPAGLFAAWEAAKAGKSVLLCERKREMGLPVRCGEAIGEEDFTRYIPMEERWIGNKVNAFILVLPNGKKIKLKSDLYSGYILNRDLFEYDIAAKASNSGAKIKMKANVIDLIKDNDGHIQGVKVLEMNEVHAYYASVVIAADGVESRISKKMGIKTTLNVDDIEPCVQATVSNANVEENALYLYAGACYAPGGYAWVFPKANNCANIGLGINGKYATKEKHSIDYLNEFLERFFPDASIQRLISGGVPVSMNLKPLNKKNLLIAGDAGHMVNPLNGGGITHAIDSGIQAGKAAVEACNTPKNIESIFRKYEKDIHKKFGKNHESLYRVKDVVYQLSDDDYNEIGEELLKIDAEKRSFFRIFSQVVKHRPEFLVDVAKAFTGI
jgi:digeranylgeranylglycerophospholipid reductase